MWLVDLLCCYSYHLHIVFDSPTIVEHIHIDQMSFIYIYILRLFCVVSCYNIRPCGRIARHSWAGNVAGARFAFRPTLIPFHVTVEVLVCVSFNVVSLDMET